MIQLGIYLKEMKSLSRRDICTPTSIAALVTIANIWNQPKCPLTDELIKKMWCVYTMKYYPTIKTKEILPFSIT